MISCARSESVTAVRKSLAGARRQAAREIEAPHQHRYAHGQGPMQLILFSKS
jgi:hypothetical protein